MRSTRSWWGAKVRQFRAHLRASVTPAERAALATWTTAAQRRVFDSMHVADQRHGLDVVASLRAGGVRDPDVLVAGLLHDAGKGDDRRLAAGRVLPRPALRQLDLAASPACCPGFGDALARLRTTPRSPRAWRLRPGARHGPSS